MCARLTSSDFPSTLLPADGDAVIARGGVRPAVVVVTAREDAEMAREARRVLAG